MTPINLPLLQEKAREIREQVDKIRRYASLPDEEFLADERNLYTVLHLLLISIEATTAICNHLMAKLAHKTPQSYADCFEQLAESGIISPELATRLVPMIRFRNLLVHRYWIIEPQRVLKIARTNLGDFEAFLREVGDWLRKEV
jgi:uncharacterized protein YutE (UPF0331/DUF86 family)